MLMEREKKVRETETSVKQYQGEVQKARQLLEMAKANPLQFLDHVGTSYEDVTQQVLKGNVPDPTADIRQELAALRKDLGDRQVREEASRREAALDEARSLVTSFVDTSEDYPLTKTAGMQDLVFQRIYDHYNNTGEALSEASAAKEVEDYLSGVVDKLSELDLVKAKTQPKEQVTEAPDIVKLASTLTNAHSAQTATRQEKGMLSDAESLQQAAAMLEYVDHT